MQKSLSFLLVDRSSSNKEERFSFHVERVGGHLIMGVWVRPKNIIAGVLNYS